MRSKRILLDVSILVILVASAGTPGPASAGVYWSPQRMAAATPLDARHTVRSEAAASVPTAQTWTGSPVVGALFLSNGSGSHYCTASVVDTPKKSLLLTAAHCLYGSGGWAKNVAFVPRYSQNARPYGIWTIGSMYVDARWQSRRDPDLDFGFAVVGTQNGKRIANVVGADRLITDQGYTNKVRIIGYPMKKYASVDKPIYCNATTNKAFKYQIRFDCAGFYGGTSGSPWIKNYNTTTRRGDVLGVIGGYEYGGKYDWRSYSPVFDRDIRHLYTVAEAHG